MPSHQHVRLYPGFSHAGVSHRISPIGAGAQQGLAGATTMAGGGGGGGGGPNVATLARPSLGPRLVLR
jgi:hypothetical protein